jgi:hypothetical protein
MHRGTIYEFSFKSGALHEGICARMDAFLGDIKTRRYARFIVIYKETLRLILLPPELNDTSIRGVYSVSEYTTCVVCGYSLAGIWVQIPPGAWMSVSCEGCVLSGTGLCDGPIPRPDESYRVFMCVTECDQV